LVEPFKTPTTGYDKLASVYDRLYLSEKDLQRSAAAHGAARECLGKVRPRGAVLDAGCGTGFLLEGVPVGEPTYVGVDISNGMLAEAKSKFPSYTFLEASVTDTRLPAGSVGAFISLFSVVNYVETSELLGEIGRICASGARVLIVARRALSSDDYQGTPEFACLWDWDTITEIHCSDTLRDVAVRPLTESVLGDDKFVVLEATRA